MPAPTTITVEYPDGAWTCESCGRDIFTGERVHVYSDELDGLAVTHVECPVRAQA